jgi:CheY-like chemotaxis protein
MGKKILLADDSITIQKVIELTFSDEDFDVVTVGNGRLAIEKVQEARPDIVLCDIIMPEKDGYEVCEFIKKTPGLQQIPVLLLTGAFEPFDQERAARVGSDGFLAKPFEPETLIAKVKDLLSRAAARPGASAPPASRPPASSPPLARPAAPAIPFVPPPRESETPARPFAPAAPLTVVPPRPPEPIPFPPRVAAPAAEPLRAPAPPAAEPPAPAAVSFIPDEPFEDLDADSFVADDETRPGVPSASGGFQPPKDDLLPMTSEESESLSMPDPNTSTSTIMFKAEAVQWQVPPPAPPAPPASSRPSLPSAPFVSAPAAPPEQELVVTEAPVFEEVIEEVEFGGGFPAATSPAYEATFEPEHFDAPPEIPAAAETQEVAPAPSSHPPSPPPPPVSQPWMAPEREAPPTIAMAPPWFQPAEPAAPPAHVAPPPVEAPVVAPPAPPSVPVAAPPAAPVEAAPAAAAEEESFADLVPEAPVAAPAPSSEAAAVSVPVDMVEKIAQRVVAQISEKVVREIAWEVIPDLAEALIRQEIERLKAELQRI